MAKKTTADPAPEAREDEVPAEAEPLVASSSDDEEIDRLSEIPTLPRVASVEVVTRTTRVDPPKEIKGPKPDVGLVLKPFVPKPKRQMVTMSDMSMSGRPRGGVTAGRNRRKPSD
ncbi:MAG: hypothetical protein RIT45_1990 [Pseudomonadota bacterium]|jgi:hypothetical protein